MADPSASLGPDVKNVPYADLINASAHAHGLPPALLAGLIQQESGFNPNIVSKAGAVGLSQLMPDTAASVGVKDAYDPAQNIEGGAKYLSAQIRHFGDVDKALAAYNAGPGAVAKYGGVPPYAETQNYVKVVEANAARYAGGAGYGGPHAGSHAHANALERDAHGTAVEHLQKQLGVKADGIFGPKTEAAVRQFQSEHHLAVDGIVGHDTRAALAARDHEAAHHTAGSAAPHPHAGPTAPPPEAPHHNGTHSSAPHKNGAPVTPPGAPGASAHPGWTEAPAPAGQHKFLAPNLQAFESVYRADPNRPDLSVKWDEKTSTLTASFTNDKQERFVATVRTGRAEDARDVHDSSHHVVLAPGHYAIAAGRHQAESWGSVGTGRAFSQVVNADGTDGIYDVTGKRHTEIGLHGGGSYVARTQGLDAAFSDKQDLRGTNGCVRLHNVDAASIADLTHDAGKPLSFEVVGRSSRQVSVSEAVGALRSEKGVALPPVTEVKAWDGKPHTGTFVKVDDDTYAQHTGRGSYVVYDLNHDLHGKAPQEGRQQSIDAQGVAAPPPREPQTAGR